MAENSKIEWCDHTFNPWLGCTKVAPGCAHCYAESFATRYNKAAWGPHGTRVKTSEAYWRKPLIWNRNAARHAATYAKFGELYTRPRVFCASLADVFEDWQGLIVDAKGVQLVGFDARPLTMDDLRRDLFALIDATPNLDWLVLTKRPEKVRRMMGWETHDRCWHTPRRQNVWLGTSIATQADADQNIPELLKCRELCQVLFLSCEPLLGPVDLAFCDPTEAVASIDDDPCYGVYPDGSTNHSPPSMIICSQRKHWRNCVDFRASACGIDWVIVGCESNGTRVGRLNRALSPAEPHPEEIWRNWAASIVAQCQLAGVPVFAKQVPINGRVNHNPDEWPADLRVREFPRVRSRGEESECAK